MRISFIALALAAGAAPAVAQAPSVASTPSRIVVSGGIAASSAQVLRDGFVANELSGPLFGATGRVGFRRLSLDVSYTEGSLTPGSGASVRETFAEANVVLRFAVGGGFSVGGGPRARAFVAPSGTVRWMRVEARGRYQRELIPGRAWADIDLWQVLSADVNAQGGSDGGRGTSAGITLQLPNSPFALRAAYTADRMAYANGTSEFLDHLEVGLRYGR